MAAEPARSANRLTAHARSVSWGFVDQVCSSATNLGLSLVAGRLLGPSGLGIVFIGYAAYLTVLGFQRSLVSEPLVASSAASPPSERRRTAGLGVTAATCCALGGSLALAIAGLSVPGKIGHGLLLFSPWLVAALLQDYWRAVLFRDGRGRAAAANDATWLGVMAITSPAIAFAHSDWAITAWWGGAACIAALLGFFQTTLRPSAPGRSWRWWRIEAWPLGRWLAASDVVYSVLSYTTVLVLVGLLGAGKVGGLQAVVVVFAPLSLVGPALALPGLPSVTNALSHSFRRARNLAAALGLIAAACILVYVGFVSLNGAGLLDVLFGRKFRGFSDLIWPVATGQVLVALALGFGILLTAQRRGRAVLASGLIAQASSLGLASILAVAYGLTGAAWGLAAGGALGASAKAAIALRTAWPHRAVCGPDTLSVPAK